MGHIQSTDCGIFTFKFLQRGNIALSPSERLYASLIDATHLISQLEHYLVGNKKAINTLNQGVVEICCLEGHTELLEHFVIQDYEDVPVWKNVLKFIASTSVEESAAAGHCLSVLTKRGKFYNHFNCLDKVT